MLMKKILKSSLATYLLLVFLFIVLPLLAIYTTFYLINHFKDTIHERYDLGQATSVVVYGCYLPCEQGFDNLETAPHADFDLELFRKYAPQAEFYHPYLNITYGPRFLAVITFADGQELMIEMRGRGSSFRIVGEPIYYIIRDPEGAARWRHEFRDKVMPQLFE